MRLLSIGSSHNLRDMGGYPAANERRTRWATLFRSGTTANLDEAAAAQMRRLGIVTVYDLRDNEERRRRPICWCDGTEARYHSRDYALSAADLSQLIREGNFDLSAVNEVIRAAYLKMPTEQAEAYRELFNLLLEGRVPLLFGCTAGKDRTGLAAALILYALGASREVIEADYRLTDATIDELIVLLTHDPRYELLAMVDRSLYLPLLRADPSYLDIAFREMARMHGSIGDYMQVRLGVGQREIDRLREVLLQ
jgi:protein-tyrosine phosphatase